jgi:imidazolonepropionase-like amidohydrolase
VLVPDELSDLLVVDGNPATDIDAVDRIVAVWHRGRQVAGTPLALTP